MDLDFDEMMRDAEEANALDLADDGIASER
jgi:hypothetical protein